MKQDFPNADDFLLATVDRIIGTSVFVKLDEYNKEGVINFSEIAPGRIRNIRDYVKPGQKIVIKVLRVDPNRGQIELSLRRVSLKDKKEIAEKHRKWNDFFVMLNVGINDKLKIQEIKIKSKEINLDDFLEAIDTKNISLLSGMGISSENLKRVFEIIDEKVRNKKVIVKANLKIQSEQPDGVERIKNTLKGCEKNNIKITYLGAPTYMITMEGQDYKELNKKMKDLLESLEKRAKENLCILEFEKK